MNLKKLISLDETQTEDCASSLSEKLKSDDVLGLIGEIGAGKTVFSRGLSKGLALPKEYSVTSPTFTLMNIYPCTIPIFHFDLYRLENIEDFSSLGIDDYKYQGAIFLIEWANKFGDQISRDLDIHIFHKSEDSREITIEAISQRGIDILNEWEYDV
ncbi:tRNA (adenosine(37)-N6)-threonylcarbamoyltransferase complex ATPase subunit type 1 TsaE [PVC group bacterium (ex Bugula neritina AB1)]|nr:tRNA (adenosine(37)-N6)-threonylcarbamoyltransferase complex ATPase subunit type 1 TsaE [PVC group bacterium (ex Bugula neritina AB1)]